MNGVRHPSIGGRGAALGVLLVCGALVPAVVAAQDPSRRVRIIRTDSTHDSAMMRVTINADQIERAIHELMASKAMEERVGLSLREAMSGQSADSKKMRELSDELARIAQKNATLVTTIEMSCAGDRQPQGYIGVQFDMLQTVTGDDVPASGQLRDFPKIDSVYPSSPASKAGIRRGDIVLSLGGQDTRRPVQLDKILKPQTKLPVRIQRDGTPKELTITIEKRPVDFNSECANVDQVIAPEFDAPMIFMRSPRTPRLAGAPGAPTAPGASPIVPRTPSAAATPDAPTTPMPAMAGFMYGFGTGSSAIAGATLMPLDDDWRATLGVDNGVLVTKVLPGTPSKDSGLRAGDVITSADGQAIASVRTLSRIVSNSKSNSVKLQIIRAGKPQVVMLRWE